MKIKFTQFWDTLRRSFWFIPTLMTAGAFLVTTLMVYIDHQVKDAHLRGIWWVYGGGPEGARAVLSTIAGSVITVAGVTYSITIAVLSLTSQQFGPRLIGNFMRDRGNQVVLGTFISTFLYCLLILRMVRGHEESLFVPLVAVTFGMFLAIVSMGVLIYFIHHVAESIQVSTIIDEVGREMDSAIARLFPAKLGEGEVEQVGRGEADLPDDFYENALPIPSTRTGYVMAIDTDRLMSICEKEDLILRLNCHPGSYIITNSPLAWVWPTSRATQATAVHVNGAFNIGRQRTIVQDAAHAVRLLVEMALRALSPSLNDPFTAIMCIDRIGASLCNLAGRVIPSPYRYDRQGMLRVIVQTTTFKDLVDIAFHQIRQNNQNHLAVTLRLLESIAVIAQYVYREEDRDVLLHHAEMIHQNSMDHLEEESDRKDLMKQYMSAREALTRTVGGG
ncbi:MAG: DUF2254 domain-containing protein [Armatimonadetes bacterium]|nr:DUF2254 domain-containing protein [Armatimonadota bacterium]